MNYLSIIKLQKETGYNEMQEMIYSGQAWLMPGSIGHQAMNALKSGACMLPLVRHRDYYGSAVPSRNDLPSGTAGTLANSLTFWSDFVAYGYEFHTDVVDGFDENGDCI